ncbi:hypothetical protein O181_027026 [Austropuccinia psidii MF-1]|uniref:Uncharacterized protein n=1 Tax=Austropuccinia psidii MF-1 TaxID=1389203 RepID=A0A9Q3CRN4_9BASI|nr:hypothetical protein [Austropuccinia psidii MF-1]
MLSFQTWATLGALSTLINLPYAAANWDTSTGNAQYTCPTQDWISKNPARHVTHGIQIAECAHNTRLHFPDIQFYAYFVIDHSKDGYHGCPYGSCYAYRGLPPVDALEINPDCHSFIWHFKGGFPGMGTREIADPKTGQAGFEESLSGKFIAGRLNFASRQMLHDLEYPGFKLANALVKAWKVNLTQVLGVVDSPLCQPKCGRACEMNQDPGLTPGTPGNYKPATAAQYRLSDPIHSKNWPTCQTDSNGQVIFTNPNPQKAGSSYCKEKPDCETCSAGVSKPLPKTNCADDPHAKGCSSNDPNPSTPQPDVPNCQENPQDPACQNGGTTPPTIDCNANPDAEGCGNNANGSPDCQNNPKAKGCKKSKNKNGSKATDCQAHPEDPSCATYGNNPPPTPDCDANPNAEGCANTQPDAPDCQSNPHSKACRKSKSKVGSQTPDCQSHPNDPSCGNYGSNPPPDCNANPNAEGCGNDATGGPDCQNNPKAKGCKKSKTKHGSKATDCQAHPEDPSCATYGNTPPTLDCEANPNAEGCANTQPDVPDCQSNPHSKACKKVKAKSGSQATDCQAYPEAPSCQNKGSNSPPDCNTNPYAEGCGNNANGSPDCQNNPKAKGCKKSKTKKGSEAPDCQANPDDPACTTYGNNLPPSPDCDANPDAEGCAQAGKQSKGKTSKHERRKCAPSENPDQRSADPTGQT